MNINIMQKFQVNVNQRPCLIVVCQVDAIKKG